jgi:PAS domain S-box-containing protein
VFDMTDPATAAPAQDGVGSAAAPVEVRPTDVLAAIMASGHAFSISDPRQQDNPLIWVNPAFEVLTGYPAAVALGRNCRFLQGPQTDPDTVRRIRRAMNSAQPITVTLLNYRRDGSSWWNEIAIAPVRDSAGQLVHFVGVQRDVTDRVVAAEQRERARGEAESAQRRLQLLAEATSILTETLNPDVSMARLAQLVVPSFADWCSVLLVQPDLYGTSTQPAQMTLHHRDPALANITQWVLERYRPGTADTPQAQVLRGGKPVLLADVGDDYIDSATNDPELAAAWRRLGMGSCIVVPLPARRRRIGCLTVVRSEPGHPYDAADLQFATELGATAGVALDNARLYTAEHSRAIALQRSLLPALPAVSGLQLAARYLPSSASTDVGGDWFDVLPLPDDAIGLAVGDVMGHDLNAAAAMGQLRSVLRSYAWEGGSPGTVLDRLDRLVRGLGMAQLATCVYARLEPANPDGGRVLRWANAGHPPPLVRLPDRTVRTLNHGHGWLIGITTPRADKPRSEARIEIPPDSTLVLYTDGLVEGRGRDIDDGIDRLHALLADADPGLAIDELAELLASTAPPGERDDDICLLLVRTA